MAQSTGRIEGTLKEILPTGRRVVIIPQDTPEYKGRIIIPDSAKTVAPTTGTIYALGFDLQDDDTNRLKVGDVVCYSKYSGVELKYDDGHRFLIVNDEDILGILKGEVTIRSDDGTER